MKRKVLSTYGSNDEEEYKHEDYVNLLSDNSSLNDSELELQSISDRRLESKGAGSSIIENPINASNPDNKYVEFVNYRQTMAKFPISRMSYIKLFVHFVC